jgi:ribonuclease HI/exonuclease III
MQHEVANTNDDKALNNMLNINALAASKGGNMTPQLYIEGMKKSATKGGLWADIPIVIWAARALKIRIQIYRMEKGILHNAQIYGPAVDPSTGEPTKCIQLLFTGPLERGHYTPITGTDCEGPVQLLPPAILAATMSDQQLKLERASSYEVPHTNTIARVIRRLAKEAFYLEQPSTTKLVQNIQMIFPQTQHMTRELQEIANSVLSQQRRSYLLAPLADAVGLIWPTAKSWQQTTTISEEATDEGGPWQIATRRRRSSGQAQAPLPQRPPNQTPTASEPPAPAPPPRGAAAPDTSGSAHPTSSSPEDKGTDEVITAPGKNINALAALKPPPNKTQRTKKTKAQVKKSDQPANKKCTQQTLHQTLAHPPGANKATIPGENSKRARSETQAAVKTPAMEPDSLATKLLLVNVRGLSSHKDETKTLLQEEQPTIIILSEHKLTPALLGSTLVGKPIQDNVLSDYTTFFSCISPNGTKQPKGRAGLAVGIKSTHLTPGKFEKFPTKAALNGYICHTVLRQVGKATTHVVGVYMPESIAKRNLIYDYIRKQIKECRAAKETLIAGGDWNAVLHASDRTGQIDTADRLHINFCREVGLSPMGHAPPGNREHTYTKDNQPTCTSRIDDVLCIHPVTGQERTVEAGGTLDHMALVVECPPSVLDLKPAEQEERENRVQDGPTLRMPIKKDQLEATKAAIAAEMTGSHTTHEAIRTSAEKLFNQLGGDMSSRNVRRLRDHLRASAELPDVNLLANALQCDMEKALEIMLRLCDKATPQSKVCFNRSQCKKYERCIQDSRKLKILTRLINTPGQDTAEEAQKLAETLGLVGTREQYDPKEAGTRAQSALHTKKRQMSRMREERTKRQDKAAIKSYQHKVATQPGKMHKLIFRDTPTDEDRHNKPLTAVRDPTTKAIHTNPQAVIDSVEQYFQGLLAPTHIIKTGEYLPDKRIPGFCYPFSDPRNPDNFQLTSHTSVTQPATQEADDPESIGPEDADLLQLLSDRCTYEDRLKHTKRNKSSGPDQIPNELIKTLPADWHTTIHNLFTIMWITGETPYAWKESVTILLHKKGDILLTTNYRPIGLANALYKLWTSNVAYVTMHHALRHQIIHKCQEGGITCRDTSRQLRNLINVFEDAYHTKQDLYCLYVDFSNAFNMVDHDKLLCIMYDLGIPSDAIDTVKGIYHQNRTSVRLPAGNTPAIEIRRGTIQGDPLSPLLFLLYIEPLLRWLHVGGRGYEHGCLGDARDASGHLLKRVHNQAAAGFIDDTSALTHTREDMAVQVVKIDTYSTWSGMPVNNKKCAVTAILHGEASRTPGRSAIDKERLTSLLGYSNSLLIGGKPVPALSPTETYKYLGLHVCLVLDWERQLEETIAMVRAQGHKLASSLASPRQCLHIMQTVIKPGIAYVLSVAPFTMAQLYKLDQEVAKIAKACYMLPQSFPTHGLLLDTQSAGLGVISLVPDYVQVSTRCLVRGVNDDDRLGLVTKALLTIQRDKMGGAPVEELSKGEARFCTTLRQLAIMNRHGIDLEIKGQIFNQLPPRPNTLYSQDGGRLAALLRSQLASPILMSPLHTLGVQHLGELVTDAGTHLITTDDLQGRYGSDKVKNGHKRALNQLSIGISGTLAKITNATPEVDEIRKYSSASPLPKDMRALPANLTLPASNHHIRRVAGTRDIRDLLTKMPSGTPHPPLPPDQLPVRYSKRTRMDRLLEDSQRCSMEPVWLGANNMLPMEVGPARPGSMAAFWQELYETARGLASSRQLCFNQGRPCAWEEFKANILASDDLPIDVLAVLYDTQFKITKIVGFESHKDPKTRRPVAHYWAKWADTLMPRKHYQACMQAYSHKGRASTPADQETIDRYPIYVLSADGNYSALDLVHVQWDDKSEPKENLMKGQPDLFPALLEAFQAEHAAGPLKKTTVAPPARDLDLPDHIRQGRNKAPLTTPLPWKVTHMVRQSVSLDPVERNPDRDIHPPRTYTIQRGTKETPNGAITGDSTAYAYHPNGKCAGTLSKACLDKLHAQYHHTKRVHPQLHSRRATTFEQDVVSLLLRHQNANREVPPQDRWSCPSHMMQTLQASLGTTMERFASPMDRSEDLEAYWSPCIEDELFGANYDAYSVPWTGSSQAHPGHDLKGCEKALRWAITSAEAYPDRPTCTVLIVPYMPGQPHMQHLSYKHSKILMHVETNQEQDDYRFNPPEYWQGMPGHELQESPRLPKHTMIAVAIFNQAGKDSILTEERVGQISHLWGREPPTSERGWLRQAQDESYTVKSPHALKKLVDAHVAHATPHYNFTHSPTAISEGDPPAHHCHAALCAAPGGTYTDGSCIKSEEGFPSIGAGVYCPAKGVTLLINPNGRGTTNTINRAELSAIHIALTHPNVGSPSEDTHLYTDSLCSIHMIKRILNEPWTLRESKHYELLHSILNALRARAEAGGKTHIYKVKSHVGVKGNEGADEAAVQAAREVQAQKPEDPPNPNHVQELSNNDPYAQRVWASYLPTPTKGNSMDEPPPRQYVSNLSEGVKRIVTPAHSGGDTAHLGIYAHAWRMALPTLHRPSSFSMWKNSHVTHRQRVLVMKARWGQMYNRKIAFRIGKVASDACPLCGQPDSTGHLLGGCQHADVKAMAISRHDQAVKLIQKAIRLSPLGGFYTIMDAGAAKTLPDDVEGKRLPAWLFPDIEATLPPAAQASEADRRKKLRPDILVVEGLQAQDTRRDETSVKEHVRTNIKKYRIHIFEVGYCSDINHAEKDADKAKQHDELVQLVRTAGFEVQYHKPISLGRCGSIPMSLYTLLRKTFHANSKRANEYCNKLSAHAAEWVDKMYTHRQCVEAACHAGAQPHRTRANNTACHARAQSHHSHTTTEAHDTHHRGGRTDPG